MEWWVILLIVLGSLFITFLIVVFFYRYFAKRVCEIIGSLLLLLMLWLPMTIIAIVIKCDSKGPALFKQKRIGKNKKPFTVLKFRTMCNHAYEIGGVASSETDDRITKVGKFLRKTSIDELPQLINIFLGQMSVIGPRPVLDWEYEEFAKEEYEPRFEVRPGMFCTVDVKYRAAAPRELQFEMDAEYAKKMSLWLDIKTFFGVLKTVFTGKNVYKEENESNE